MTPQSVINDLIYLERYHRTHGAPLTADAVIRARTLIYKQSLALGTLDTEKPEAVMVTLVSEIDGLFAELKRLQGLVDKQTEMLAKSL
jgi:hypothetical protein